MHPRTRKDRDLKDSNLKDQAVEQNTIAEIFCVCFFPKVGKAIMDSIQRRAFCDKKKETRTIFIGENTPPT